MSRTPIGAVLGLGGALRVRRLPSRLPGTVITVLTLAGALWMGACGSPQEPVPDLDSPIHRTVQPVIDACSLVSDASKDALAGGPATWSNYRMFPNRPQDECIVNLKAAPTEENEASVQIIQTDEPPHQLRSKVVTRPLTVAGAPPGSLVSQDNWVFVPKVVGGVRFMILIIARYTTEAGVTKPVIGLTQLTAIVAEVYANLK